MTNIKLLSYNKYSGSCKELKQALLARGMRRVLTIENPKYVTAKDFCVVWGDTTKCQELENREENQYPKKILNAQLSKTVVNKLAFFDFLKRYKPWREAIPTFVQHKTEVPALFASMKGKDKIIVCRIKLSSSGGDGIVLIDETTPADKIPTCHLYVEYIKKQHEFRVHIFKKADKTHGVLVQQKLRRKTRIDEGTVDYKVRNLENGWVYEKLEEHTIPQAFIDSLQELTRHLGIHFAAYDVIYNSLKDKYYILEANTAPGISNDTVDFYADIIMDHYNNIENNDITGVE